MPHTHTPARDVQTELARLTGTRPDDWFLVFRARYGMEAVLRALADVRRSGEVITQPFTCTTAVNPILSAGHIPVYVDTSDDDLSLDTAKLQASNSTRAVIMQHSFGIESNMKKARAFADKHRLLLLEDSAHQLGMLAKENGAPLADVSIHSFGVEKLLPTKFGGAVWVNPAMKDTELQGAIRTKLEQLPVLGRSDGGKARRYRFFNRVLNHTPSFFEPSLRNLLTTTHLFEPAIMPDELTGRNHSAPTRPDRFVLQEMLHGLNNYPAIVKKRRAATDRYRELLPQELTAALRLPDNYAPTRFPLLCRDADEAARLFDVLRAAGHYSGKWYRPTLFPGVTDPALYNYDPELCPVAEDISARILNLPTNITANEAKEITDVICREITR